MLTVLPSLGRCRLGRLPVLVNVADAAAQGFHFASLLLRRDPPAHASGGWLGLDAALRRHSRLEDHFGETRAGCLTVQELAAMLAGLKDETPVSRDPAAIEFLEPF